MKEPTVAFSMQINQGFPVIFDVEGPLPVFPLWGNERMTCLTFALRIRQAWF